MMDTDDEGPASAPAAPLDGREIASRLARESSGWPEVFDELPTSVASGDELCELSDECVEPFGRL